MYLRIPNDVTIEALPSRIKFGIHDMLGVFDVNGEATDASASERLTPACACFRLAMSLAPSPHCNDQRARRQQHCLISIAR